MAIRFALKKAIRYIHLSCVMISTDNTTEVSYINKQGGTRSPKLCVEVWEILHWCLEHDVVIRVRHISVQNRSYYSSLVPTSMVLRGITTIIIKSISSSALSTTPDTVKRRVSTSKLLLLDLQAWELSNSQLEINSFRKTLQTLSQNQDEHRLRKSMILHWCLEHDVVIRDQTIANSIFQMLNYPNVDLFATRFNHKLPLYVSPVPDSHALAVDAFSVNWNLLHAYAFPPIILILTDLAKIISVQNRSYCSSLAPTSMILRGIITIIISSNSSSALSTTSDTVKGKVSTSKSPITRP